jgi:4-hydroxybenzoate polyprenyltransferase
MKRHLQHKPLLWALIEIARLDKPIGIYLLLWPTLWAVWIAGNGNPMFSTLLIFSLGVIVMRSAGCVINDYADRHVDGHVERTQHRPLANGRLSEKQALLFFVALCTSAFILVLFTNLMTIAMSFGGLALAAIYPFMKRYTYLPQVVLGAAFSWAIPMAFTAEQEALPKVVWLLYIANLSWTVAYDTLYAMVDRDDDLRIGVKSTAILFGDMDKFMVGMLQTIALFALVLVGHQLAFSWPYYVSLTISVGLFGYHQWLIRDREKQACFRAFLHNHWVGAVIFCGIVGHYLLMN